MRPHITDISCAGFLLCALTVSSCDDSEPTSPEQGTPRTWVVVREPAGDDYYGVWISPTGDVFVVGENGSALRSSDGQDWTEIDAGVSATLRGVYGFSSDDVYAVGTEGTALHFDGVSWSPFVSPTSVSLYGIAITPGGELFVVGDSGIRARFLGNDWEVVSELGDWYLGVWGATAADVFAVGSGGIVSRYDGQSWNAMPNIAHTPLFDVWGTSATNVYAVGFDGTIIQYDGDEWVKVDSGQEAGHLQVLRGVWGTGSYDVFAVGGYNLWDDEAGAHNCVIVHSNGGDFEVQKSATTLNLADVFGRASVVYAVGDRGVIVRY